jgi:hypothetical protein
MSKDRNGCGIYRKNKYIWDTTDYLGPIIERYGVVVYIMWVNNLF